MEMDSRKEGNVSQWNEGNLKSLRLHNSQELINVSKIEPLRQIDNNTWNFQRWIEGIYILYGEGCSKYKTEEINEIKKIKDLLTRLLLSKSPIICIPQVMGIRRSNQIRIDYENWEIIRKVIEMYEEKVKLFNDLHGLSTRNYDDDWEGL